MGLSVNYASFGRLMVDLSGTVLQNEEYELLQNAQIGGVILFSRNFSNRAQICELVANIRAISSSLLIAVDQEGGKVQRFKNGFTPLPSMQKLGDLVIENRDRGASISHETGWLMASEILACGLDISFAPVLDVDRDTSTIIGTRAFSNIPEVVYTAGQAFIEGMHDAGMAATGKHFPGHGGIAADSHLEAPLDPRSMDSLVKHDLLPFSRLMHELDGVMTAHITFPEIDHKSVGFSSYWIQQVLRKELGFDGVVFSDDLSMKGADTAGGFADKTRMALKAGCDMILVCNNRMGVEEVIQFMEKRKYSGSKRIHNMLARKKPTWESLVRLSRYKKIVAALSEI